MGYPDTSRRLGLDEDASRRAEKMDRPSSTICSWTLGSGTIPTAVNSDPFATFNPRYLFWLTMTGMPSTYGKILGMVSGPASPSCMTASTSSSLGTRVVHWCAERKRDTFMPCSLPYSRAACKVRSHRCGFYGVMPVRP
jgi:hypothetical protein